MRTVPKWFYKVQDSEKIEQCIYDLCFNPKGTQLIVASGTRVLVYCTNDGSLIEALKGHKELVYCVCYAKNGQRFASGGADKSVIIWSNKLEGILKYHHGDAIQCLAYNPLSHQLASCALSDFGFWTAEQKAVQKHKVSARINACSWTSDGQYLALGLGNGIVSIRNKLGEEKVRIERPGAPPIWALSWNTNKDDPLDTLCITDWNKTLTFYSLAGKIIGKERIIGFDALKVDYFPSGQYVLISGTNKACNLYTKDGIKLGMIGDQQNSWVWCTAAHPSGDHIVLGCQDGTLIYYQLIFNTVHGLFKERYAFRENMTDVIIQHLLTEKKVKIKCRDLIKKIAIYKNRLAVQLSERVVIYELFSEDLNDMHYRVKEKITQKLDCSLLVVCSEHLVVCKEKKLQSMTLTGVKDKEWEFESTIRYIKVVGGPPSKEGLIAGLKNGQVWKIHLDNSFPLLILTINGAVRCLDMTSIKDKISVVDETGLCQVFDLKTGNLLYQEPNVNSVAWNTNCDDMLAFSGEDTLGIKVADFPASRHKLNGFVVGMSGSKVFCLSGASIATQELSLSTPMYQYMEKKMYQQAYRVACLGVTDGDWEELAFAAIEDLELEVAKLAFTKLQNYKFLDLIQDIQERQRKGENNRDVFVGDIYAHRGRFKDAAKLYQRAGQNHRALAMYSDLRMFEEAQQFLGSADNTALVRQKAEWCCTINEHKAAIEMYLSIGETQKAIDIMAEQGWDDQLIDMGRIVDKNERAILTSIAEHLKRLGKLSAAAEIYRRLGDTSSVLQIHVEAEEWKQAFSILQGQPQNKALVYIPYARWLAENDKFVQAQKAFYKAGYPGEAFMVLRQLTENAVSECRFQDAGYYYWILARQCLELATESEDKRVEMLKKFHENETLASTYYAYDIVYRYLEEPFTSYLPEALFNIARFLIAQPQPEGVSLFAICYTLAKQARTLGANKLAKQLFDRLQNMKIPPKFQEQIEIATIACRAKPYCDPEELLPMCYRCSTYNSLSTVSTRCNNCRQKFVYSFVSFEILPLVEFELAEGISDMEAVRLIETPTKAEAEHTDGWKQDVTDTHEVLQFEGETEESDPFTYRFINLESSDNEYLPVIANRSTLLSMDSANVLICKWKPPLRYQYFRNLLPDVQIIMCHSCFKAFHAEDFELQVLLKGFCPFCRAPPENSANVDSTEDLLNLM